MVANGEQPVVYFTHWAMGFMVAVQAGAHHSITSRVDSFNTTAKLVRTLSLVSIFIVSVVVALRPLLCFVVAVVVTMFTARKLGLVSAYCFIDFKDRPLARIVLVCLSGGVMMNTLRVPDSRDYYQRLYWYVMANHRELLESIEDLEDMAAYAMVLMVVEWEADHLHWLLGLPPARRSEGNIYYYGL